MATNDHIVERDQGLAVASSADPQCSSGHLGQVVGVVGLAQLEHHVVGHVDDVMVDEAPRHLDDRSAA